MDTWQKCPVCNGNGTVPYALMNTITCNVCHGHGIISHITGLPPAGVKVTVNTGTTTVTGVSTGTNITYRTDNPTTATDGSKKS